MGRFLLMATGIVVAALGSTAALYPSAVSRLLGIELQMSSEPLSASMPDGRSTQTLYLSFDDCLARINSFASQYRAAPMLVVDSADVRVVRFFARDGSVLVTCSHLDRKMLVTISDHR